MLFRSMEMKVSSEIRGISLSDCASDPEEKEVSDDDDDDRNHKHRRRDISSQSMGGDQQEQYFSASYRKLAKPLDKGYSSLESNLQSHYSIDGELSSRFEKPRHSMTKFSRFPIEVNPKHPSFSGDYGFNRGRSRDSGSWSQHSSRVNRFDIASQMVPPGPIPPFFPGMGLHSGLNTQNAPWPGGFGLIPGMPNGAIDPIHPLGLQGQLRSPLNSSLNTGVPRQGCRDFEERGFCLRGDMCPMEHGVNRIVIEDVQSLSQFNLPVSLPSAHLMGNSTGSAIDPQVNASSGVLINNNGFGIDADGYALSGAPDEAVDGSGADVYDPDQPLWNNDCPQTSTGILSMQTSASFTESDPSSQLARSSAAAFGVQSTSSSVWGRMNASENRVVSRAKVDSRATSSEFESATKEKSEVYNNIQTADQKSNTGELADSTSKLQKHNGHSFKNPAQKALRSLYVNHIPLKNNKKEALLSHFRKFGDVIDIYIPPNTEQAFVQFSKREEAERALKSPEAVMGNRFIRLLWAYRDSFFPGGVGGKNMARMPDRMQETSVALQQSTANTGKENIHRVVPMVSAPGSGGSSRTFSSEVRPPITNGPKAPTAPPVHKKLENLELLKEEVRKKQELLEQRRKEFRQQLDKLQKIATGIKGEVPEVQASKKLKVEGADDSPKSETRKLPKLQAAGVDMPAGGSLHKLQLVESATLHSLKTKFSAASQELSNLKNAARPHALVGSPYPTNRYKLDNRPTSFRVSSPLPAEFANVNAVRDHFVAFGDLSNVDLENSDVQGDDDKCSEKSKNTSARVSFKTRQAAERAFVNGKSWNGHSLQLTWLMPTKSAGSPKDKSPASEKPSGTTRLDSSGERGSSVSAAKEASGIEIQSMEKSTCDVSQDSLASFSGAEAQSADKSSAAGSSLEASGPGSTDSEVVEKEGSAQLQMEKKEDSKSVSGEIGEAKGEA
ncbi:hypothetical protein V2J09_011651 [Rumex salicifolius]